MKYYMNISCDIHLLNKYLKFVFFIKLLFVTIYFVQPRQFSVVLLYLAYSRILITEKLVKIPINFFYAVSNRTTKIF